MTVEDALRERIAELEARLREPKDGTPSLKLQARWGATPTEAAILLLLVKHPKHPVARETIIYRLGLGETANAVSVHVFNIREKTGIPIKSVRGYGYLLTEEGRRIVGEALGAS